VLCCFLKLQSTNSGWLNIANLRLIAKVSLNLSQNVCKRSSALFNCFGLNPENAPYASLSKFAENVIKRIRENHETPYSSGCNCIAFRESYWTSVFSNLKRVSCILKARIFTVVFLPKSAITFICKQMKTILKHFFNCKKTNTWC